MITGSVARVVSDRELIINRGSEHGVTEGMIFKVLDAVPVEIIDPETQESLGAVQRVKVVVNAHEVSDKFTIVRTFRQRRINVGGSGVGSFSALFTPPKYEYRTETLRIDPDKGRPISASQSIVSVGDRVEESSHEEAEEIETVTLFR